MGEASRAADRRRRQPHRRRRARAGPGRERERRVRLRGVGRPARAERPAAGRHPRHRRRRRDARVSRAVSRRRQVVSLPDRDDARAVAVRSVLRVARARAARHRGDAQRRGAAGRPPRLRVVPGARRVRSATTVRTHRTLDRHPGGAAARSSSRSTATGSCATWSAPSSARWPRSAPGPGTPDSIDGDARTRAIGRRAVRRRRRRA